MNHQAIRMLHRKDLLFSRRHLFFCVAAGVAASLLVIFVAIGINLIMQTRKRDLL